MDTGAELTLQIVRRAQSYARPDVPQAPDLWLLWPGGERLDWVRARARLGGLREAMLRGAQTGRRAWSRQPGAVLRGEARCARRRGRTHPVRIRLIAV